MENLSIEMTYESKIRQISHVSGFSDLVFEFNWYDIEVTDAIRVRDPGDINSGNCLEATGRVAIGHSLSAIWMLDFLCNVDSPSTSSAGLARFESPLVNISSLETSGVDLNLNSVSPIRPAGAFGC